MKAYVEALRRDGLYRFVVLPGLSHWIPDQAPNTLAALILDNITE